MLKEIHVVLGDGVGPANEIFIETEDQDGKSIGRNHGLRSEITADGRDIIIDMVKPIRTFLQEAKRDMTKLGGRHVLEEEGVIDNLLQRLENMASE